MGKTNYIFLLLLIASCSKLDSNAPVIPPPTRTPVTVTPDGDSLFFWQAVGHSSGEAIVDIWFTSLNEGFCACNDGNLYRSTTAGYTWQKIPNSGSFGMQSLYFVNDQFGFAENAQQMQVTKDGGKTWKLRNLPTRGVSSIFFVNPSTGYYADVDSGLYKSVDTGNHWQPIYHPALTRQALYSCFIDETTGFMVSGEGKFYKTINASASWQQVTSNVNSITDSRDYNTLVFPDAFNGFYASRLGLFKTNNGGVDWRLVSTAGGSVNVVQMVDNHTGYFMSDSAIYTTTDAGETWTTSCRLAKDRFLGMHFFDATRGWAGTAGGTVYRLSL